MKPELAVVSDCSIDGTITDSPNSLDRPLRKPRLPPIGVSLLGGRDSRPTGAIDDTIWKPDSLEPQRWPGYAPHLMPRSTDTNAFWEAVRRSLYGMELRYGRGSALFGPVRGDLARPVLN
jgi:hypothetical protein